MSNVEAQSRQGWIKIQMSGRLFWHLVPLWRGWYLELAYHERICKRN